LSTLQPSTVFPLLQFFFFRAPGSREFRDFPSPRPERANTCLRFLPRIYAGTTIAATECPRFFMTAPPCHFSRLFSRTGRAGSPLLVLAVTCDGRFPYRRRTFLISPSPRRHAGGESARGLNRVSHGLSPGGTSVTFCYCRVRQDHLFLPCPDVLDMVAFSAFFKGPKQGYPLIILVFG